MFQSLTLGQENPTEKNTHTHNPNRGKTKKITPTETRPPSLKSKRNRNPLQLGRIARILKVLVLDVEENSTKSAPHPHALRRNHSTLEVPSSFVFFFCESIETVGKIVKEKGNHLLRPLCSKRKNQEIIGKSTSVKVMITHFSQVEPVPFSSGVEGGISIDGSVFLSPSARQNRTDTTPIALVLVVISINSCRLCRPINWSVDRRAPFFSFLQRNSRDSWNVSSKIADLRQQLDKHDNKIDQLQAKSFWFGLERLSKQDGGHPHAQKEKNSETRYQTTTKKQSKNDPSKWRKEKQRLCPDRLLDWQVIGRPERSPRGADTKWAWPPSICVCVCTSSSSSCASSTFSSVPPRTTFYSASARTAGEQYFFSFFFPSQFYFRPKKNEEEEE